VHDTAIIVKFFQTTSREREPALLIGGTSSTIEKQDAARRIP
jgi:hypothetical protein